LDRRELFVSVSSERYCRLYFTGLFQIYGVRGRDGGESSLTILREITR